MPDTPNCLDSQTPTDHEWAVLCTGSDQATKAVYLVVQCVDCGAMGKVNDPTKEEWNNTTGDEPYPWEDAWRVSIENLRATTRYVTREATDA